jgi:hypothetical protein
VSPNVEVKFAAYRQYLDQRQLVNSAVMALLAGSQLANHTLQLTQGSDRTLPEIFPRVPHIDRFNLKSDVASGYLSDAEAHLSAMAIPYILTILEALFGTFEEMLIEAGTRPRRTNKNTSSVWVVKNHWDTIRQKRDEPSWLVLELMIQLRHDITHQADAARDKTVKAPQTLTSDAEALWLRMAKEPAPKFALGQRHTLDHADMLVCLAVAKFIANEGNQIMQTCYPRHLWLRDLVRDIDATHGFQGNLNQKVRHSRTFARRNYGPLSFTDAELAREIEAQEM